MLNWRRCKLSNSRCCSCCSYFLSSCRSKGFLTRLPLLARELPPSSMVEASSSKGFALVSPPLDSVPPGLPAPAAYCACWAAAALDAASCCSYSSLRCSLRASSSKMAVREAEGLEVQTNCTFEAGSIFSRGSVKCKACGLPRWLLLLPLLR